jgi:hypothetical protein
MYFFLGVLDHKLEDLDMPKFQDAVKSVHDWRCVVLGLEKDNPLQAFFLGI